VGQEIDREVFGEEDYRRFAARLREGVAAIRELLARPGFGARSPAIGVELEVSLVGRDGEPAPVNEAVKDACPDGVSLELDRFNLECDSRPAPLTGRPFTALGEDMRAALGEIGAAAEEHGAEPATVGILPTLRPEHLGPRALSDSPRFRALAAALARLRQGPFRVRIDGEEPLDLRWSDVSLEGATTAFHLHLDVPPPRFAATFNAALAATAPALAVAGNSPLLFGRLLWEETRIPLFHQSVDDRAEPGERWRPDRASFGHGWCQGGAAELFAQSAALHVPMLPVVSDEEDALATVRAGGVPRLEELRLHHGTVWHWSRPVYSPADGGQLRLELRALPSGPTPDDMLANAAFLVGLTTALAREASWLTSALPFALARDNFYAAARHGLQAVLLWPSAEPPSPRPELAGALVRRLSPLAGEGLAESGVADDEAARLLAIVEARAAASQTGAAWQRRSLAQLERRLPRRRALAVLLGDYLERSAEGAPVHTWPLAL
jgi:gamma-glutamyl:cysteine ligase YbdK (ATP-grasp superfamily)